MKDRGGQFIITASGLSQNSGVSAVVVACDVAITGHQTVITQQLISGNSSLGWRFLNQLTVSICMAREIQVLMSLQVDQEMALLQGRGHLYFVLLWFCSLLDLISSECCLIMIGRENRQMSFPPLPQNGGAKVSNEKKRQHLKIRLKKKKLTPNLMKAQHD